MIVLHLAVATPVHAGFTIDIPQTITDALMIAAAAAYNSTVEAIMTLESTNEENLASAKLDTAATAVTMAKAEAGVYSSQLKTHVIALAALDGNRQFSALSQSCFNCCDDELGIALIQGESKRKETQDDLYSAVVSYNNNFVSSNVLYGQLLPVANQPIVDMGWAIFPLHETATTPSNTLRSIILATNPMPALKATPAVLGTSAGQQYEVLRKIQLSKHAIPQRVATDIASYHMPAYDLADWHTQMQKSKGVPAGSSAAIVNNELSTDAVLKMQVHSRYSNPNWGYDLHRKYPNGLWRELLQMEAIDLKFQQRLLKLAEQRLAVHSQDHANLVAKKYDPQIDQLMHSVILQQRSN